MLPQPSPVKPCNPPELPAEFLAAPCPIRELKRRHGGAWKVAYADFVTALMALFIVLWMMNASHKVKASVTGVLSRSARVYTKTGGGAGRLRGKSGGESAHRRRPAETDRGGAP